VTMLAPEGAFLFGRIDTVSGVFLPDVVRRRRWF
jgi:hypothetical protein